MYSLHRQRTMEFFKLSNGVQIPKVGLGTSHSGGYSHAAAVYALTDCNYSLIDTAKRYGNEAKLQEAIAASGRNREELFLSTKLWPSDYGSSSCRAAVFGSLKRLGTEHLDLCLLHWPLVPSWCADPKQLLRDTWRTLENLYDEGLCRAIGVSNFSEHDLLDLLENASIIPHVNQSEFHVQQNAGPLRVFCYENRIQFEGYCPLGKGSLVSVPTVVEMAHKYCKTPAQILIRWSVQHDAVTIPKSTNFDRLKENIKMFDFEILPSDMDLLDALHTGRYLVNRSTIQDKLDKNMPDGYKLNVPRVSPINPVKKSA